MGPLISVLMSTFNRGKTINNAIKSIINQTYTNFELIICDDGSTDSTLKYLKMWSRKDNRIKLLVNKHNCGLQVSLNRCINASKGKYIARMDDDDISLPNRLETQLRFIKQHPNIDFVGSNIELFNKNYNYVYGKEIFPEFPNKYQLFKKDLFCHPSILIRSDILKEVGEYSVKSQFFRVEDYELWLRLYFLGYKGANIQQFLLKYHLNINGHRNKYYDYYNRFRLLLYYKKKLHINYKGYLYVILPLFKLLVPNAIRNRIYFYKYK